MHARIKNPALSVPGALDALRQLGDSATTAGIPETTLYMVDLRASQINGCAVCVDIHSRELEYAGETSERIHTIAAWRETPYQPPERDHQADHRRVRRPDRPGGRPATGVTYVSADGERRDRRRSPRGSSGGDSIRPRSRT